MIRVRPRDLVAAAAIAAATLAAIRGTAERKIRDAVGEGAYPVADASAEDRARFDALLADIAAMGRPEAASSLAAMAAGGDVWIAPDLAGREGFFVDVLGIERIHVSESALREPDRWRAAGASGKRREGLARQRLSSRLQLSGALYHEWLHAGGLLDEGPTYEREVEFYRGVPDSEFGLALSEEDRSLLAGAVENAIASALEASRRAGS